eukprot:gene25680-31013_t
MLRRLAEIAQKIIAEVDHCWGFNQAYSSRQYRNGEWRHITRDLPVLPHTLRISDKEFDNHLGNYLNDLACAHMIGAHFVTVYHKLFVHENDERAINAHDIETDEDSRKLFTFVKYLPHVVMHPKYSYILKDSQRAVDKAMDLERAGTVVNIHDILVLGTANPTNNAISPSPRLPLLPSVTIQCECGDNINFKEGRYGLAKFGFFRSERLLGLGALTDEDVRFIYILTESLSRSRLGPCSSCCETVLRKLQGHVSHMFPHAVVLVKRGGDIFADYARLSLSNVVFCSASTFCLWLAAANDRGVVFLPFTGLFAGADNSSVAPDLGNSKHFVNVSIVSTLHSVRGGFGRSGRGNLDRGEELYMQAMQQ